MLHDPVKLSAICFQRFGHGGFGKKHTFSKFYSTVIKSCRIKLFTLQVAFRGHHPSIWNNISAQQQNTEILGCFNIHLFSLFFPLQSWCPSQLQRSSTILPVTHYLPPVQEPGNSATEVAQVDEKNLLLSIFFSIVESLQINICLTIQMPIKQ